MTCEGHGCNVDVVDTADEMVVGVNVDVLGTKEVLAGVAVEGGVRTGVGVVVIVGAGADVNDMEGVAGNGVLECVI